VKGVSVVAVDVWPKALRHRVRRSIVRQLSACERLSTTELAAVVDEPVANVAYHVQLLKDLGVIRLVARTQVRGALQHHYTLADRDAAALALAGRERRRGLSETGAAFRRARESRNVPVCELAGRVGINVKRLERIEAGEVDAQLRLLFELAARVAQPSGSPGTLNSPFEGADP
jgi:DNA-binding XRE family transcriptional regulator